MLLEKIKLEKAYESNNNNNNQLNHGSIREFESICQKNRDSFPSLSHTLEFINELNKKNYLCLHPYYINVLDLHITNAIPKMIKAYNQIKENNYDDNITFDYKEKINNIIFYAIPSASDYTIFLNEKHTHLKFKP